MSLLSNGSNYSIFNVKHTVRNDLIIYEPIPMTNIDKLEKLYELIKYTTFFLEENDVDYCIESGTLLGCVRHEGIIPWDNDIDIMIFREGYYKLKKIYNSFNNDNFKLVNITPGFKLFYNNECLGELFVYDYDDTLGLYRMSYPYIDNDKPSFITSNIFFPHQKYKKDDLFPTRRTLFEDFYVRTPNNIINILTTTYRGNLLECVYDYKLNNQHEVLKYDNYKFLHNIEKFLCNKILLFIYILLCLLLKKNMIIML